MISRAQSRRAGIGLLAFIVPLPLQWQSLGHSPLGTIRYFDVGAALMLIIAWPSRAALRVVLDKARPLPAAAVLVTVCASAAAVFWHGIVINPLQVFIYLVVGLIGGAVLIMALAHEGGQRLVALAGPATVGVFIVMFSWAIQRAGINALNTFQQALLQGNTHALEFGLYRAAFRTTDPNARDNLRHEVVAALLVACYLGMAISAYAGRFKTLNIATALLVFVLVSVSLSRSVMIAMVIPMVLAAIKVLVRPKMPVWGFLGIAIFVATSPLLFAKVGPLLAARFADTGSYNGRVSNLTSFTIGQVFERGLAGGKTLSLSTHMWVVDSFLNGSILGGLGAAICVYVMFRLGWEALVLYFREGGVFYYSVVAAVTVTIMRAFTTGGGNIYQGEWFAIGMAAACLWLVRNRPAGTGPPTAENQPVDFSEPEPTMDEPARPPQRLAVRTR